MKKFNLHKFINTFMLFVFFAFISTTTVLAASPITLDGDFSDWVGQTCISDPIGDASTSANDLTSFCYASDLTAEISYFMVERLEDTNRPLTAVIYLDTNDNGSYSDSNDRSIEIFYNSNQVSSRVDVDVFDGSGNFLTSIAAGENWGRNGQNGAHQVELGVPWSELLIAPGSTLSMTMYVVSFQGSALDDGTVEIQWTPADALGYILIGLLILIASIGLAYIMKKKEINQD